MEAFLPSLARIFTPIAYLALTCDVLLGLAVLHALADLAMMRWLRTARLELQQIVGQYQPDYVPYQAMTMNRVLKWTRPLFFYPILFLILVMVLACTVLLPKLIARATGASLEANGVSLRVSRAWLNPFSGNITLRGVTATRTGDAIQDFDLSFDTVDINLRLLSTMDPVHRYDMIRFQHVNGTYTHKAAVTQSVDPADGVVVDKILIEDMRLTFIDQSLGPIPPQTDAPTVKFDMQIDQATVNLFRSLHPAFDLMTSLVGTGSIDGHPADSQCAQTDDKTIVTMHFESIDIAKFRPYFRHTLPQLAGGILDVSVQQSIDNHDPKAKVEFSVNYQFRDVKTQPVDDATLENPKVFSQINSFLVKHTSQLQVPTTFAIDRATYEKAPSFIASGAMTIERKAFETDLLGQVLKETNVSSMPQAESIYDIRSLVPNGSKNNR